MTPRTFTPSALARVADICASVHGAEVDRADIAAQAEESARELLRQGWDPAGGEYDIGVYHGDLEALFCRMRAIPTSSQARALEECIRVLLDDARAQADTAQWVAAFEGGNEARSCRDMPDPCDDATALGYMVTGGAK